MSSGWKEVARVVHLHGGIQAINPPGAEVIILPGASCSAETRITIPSYAALCSTLIGLGLDVVGIDFYTSQEQLDRDRPRDWMPVDHEFGVVDHPTRGPTNAWQDLVHAGVNANDARFADLASRIAFASRSSVHRLRDLSEWYRRELEDLCARKTFEDGLQFETDQSFFLFMATHALLVDLCTLRDYLAEFVAAYLLAQYVPDEMRITRMSSLSKHVLREAAIHDAVAAEMLAATKGPSGWLARLSAYRDLVVHVMPLAHAAHRSLLWARWLTTSDGRRYPSIRFPIPPDPYVLQNGLVAGHSHASAEDWLASTDVPAGGDSPDALRYGATAIAQMMNLASTIIARAPHEPKPMVLTEEDLAGPLVVRLDGEPS